ncbi:MAG: hypothetical protein IKO95_04695 [Spirochaetia bacterium]|nr:hypothetical protein [Spirochaetia bacterium]
MINVKPTKCVLLLFLLLLSLFSCKAENKIQTIAQQVSEEIMEQYEPLEGVMTLVADAKTGEVIASVDLGGTGDNRSETYTYEPGSVFKIFSISSAMFLPNGITSDSKFNCEGFYDKVKGNPIKCIKVHGEIDTGDIIKYSCYSGTCSAVETVTDKELHFMLSQFGFRVLPPEEWSERSKYTVALGQGIAVTVKQMVKAATVFANHGMLGAGEMEVVSPKVADDMLLMMEKATQPDGIARLHGVKDCRVAIVPGTAQWYDPETKTYSDNKFVASALAIFPVEEPRYIVYNVVLHPSKGGITTGTGICVPAVGKIINEVIRK